MDKTRQAKGGMMITKYHDGLQGKLEASLLLAITNKPPLVADSEQIIGATMLYLNIPYDEAKERVAQTLKTFHGLNKTRAKGEGTMTLRVAPDRRFRDNEIALYKDGEYVRVLLDNGYDWVEIWLPSRQEDISVKRDKLTRLERKENDGSSNPQERVG